MKTEQNTVNIKAIPLQVQLGVLKFENDDWGIESFFIPRKALESKFIEPDLQYNCVYLLVGAESVTVFRGRDIDESFLGLVLSVCVASHCTTIYQIRQNRKK